MTSDDVITQLLEVELGVQKLQEFRHYHSKQPLSMPLVFVYHGDVYHGDGEIDTFLDRVGTVLAIHV